MRIKHKNKNLGFISVSFVRGWRHNSRHTVICWLSLKFSSDPNLSPYI